MLETHAMSLPRTAGYLSWACQVVAAVILAIYLVNRQSGGTVPPGVPVST